MSVSITSLGLVQITCAACGEEFGCGANTPCEGPKPDCWCATIQVSDAKLEEIQARYQGCLCRNCLVKLADDRT